MKAYYRKVESKRAGKGCSWGIYKNAKSMSGLKKYLDKNKLR